MKRWDVADDHKLRRLAGTHTALQIGAELGRSDKAVWVRARRIGVRLQKQGDHNPGVRWPDALVERARCLHDEGRGPSDIARDLRIPRNTVRSFVHYRHRLGAAA